MVDVWETTSKTAQEYSKHRTSARHVLIAQFLPRLNVLLITLPGFTQALAGGDRSTYAKFATEAVAILQKQLGLSIATVALKSLADAALSDPAAKVIDVGRKIKLGGIDLAAHTSSDIEGLAAMLSKALKNDGDIAAEPEKIKRMIERSPGDDIILFWQKLGLTTRMSVREEPNEVLIIWTKISATSAIADELISTLVRYKDVASNSGMQEALTYLRTLTADTIVQPYYLTQKFSIDLQDAFSLLFKLAQDHIFEARYRLETDADLTTYFNRWVSSLAEIPTHVTTSTGEELDVLRPDAIEIGFQRVEL